MTSVADDDPPTLRRGRRRRNLRDIRQQALLRGGAVQVEANLPRTSIVIAQFSLLKYSKKIFDLENEGQSDVAQHPQWCFSMADVNLYKSRGMNLYASFIVFEIIASLQMFDHENLGKGHREQHS